VGNKGSNRPQRVPFEKKVHQCSHQWTGAPTDGQGAPEKKTRESDGRSRPVVGRQQVMRDVKEVRDEKRKIPLCARSEVLKIKYPRTCLIHICADIICCAFTEFWYRRREWTNGIIACDATRM
jgi:hypothetical protein